MDIRSAASTESDDVGSESDGGTGGVSPGAVIRFGLVWLGFGGAYCRLRLPLPPLYVLSS